MSQEIFQKESQHLRLSKIQPAKEHTVEQMEVLEEVTIEDLSLKVYCKDQPIFEYFGTVLISEAHLVTIVPNKKTYFATYELSLMFAYIKPTSLKNQIVLSCGANKVEMVCKTVENFRKLKQLIEPSTISMGFKEQFIQEEALGSGTSSKVYLVKCKATNEEYAAKKIKKSYILEKSSRYCSLVNEIKLHQSLRRCPSVVKLHRVVEDPDNVYLILEAMRGGSLLDLLIHEQKERPLKESEVLHIMEQILLSVDLLHQNKIVHRDIKLDNILLKEKYNEMSGFSSLDVKLCDLGLGQRLASEQVQSVICGTPGYIAPEILKKRWYGTKADIFSIGSVMYSLLTADCLIDGNSIKEVVQNNKEFKLESLLPRIEHFSDATKNLLQGLLNHHQRHRFSAQEALRSELFGEDDEAIQDVLMLNEVVVLSSTSPRNGTHLNEQHRLSQMSDMLACLIEEDNEGEEIEQDLEEDKQPSNVAYEESKSCQNNNFSSSLGKQQLHGSLGKHTKVHKIINGEESKHQRKGSAGSQAIKKDLTFGQFLEHKRKSSPQSLQRGPCTHQKSSFFKKYLKKGGSKNIQGLGSNLQKETGSSLEIGDEFSLSSLESKGIEAYCKEEYTINFAVKNKSQQSKKSSDDE